MPSPLINYRTAPRDLEWLGARSHTPPRPDMSVVAGDWATAARLAQRRYAALLGEAEAEAVALLGEAVEVATAVLAELTDLDEARALLEDTLQGPLGRSVGLTPAAAGRLVGSLRPWHLAALADMADRRAAERRRRRR